MKNAELFHRTVNILVQAYLNNTLQHGNCAACAVGNIIASNCRFKINTFLVNEWSNGVLPRWSDVFVTPQPNSPAQKTNPDNYEGVAKKQIDSTGYSWQDLAKIEWAFEKAPGYNPRGMDEQSLTEAYNDDRWMFNGLMAVVDTLCEIHEMNEESKQEVKALFVRC